MPWMSRVSGKDGGRAVLLDCYFYLATLTNHIGLNSIFISVYFSNEMIILHTSWGSSGALCI